MISKGLVCACLTLALSVLATSSARAQGQTTGNITGVVRDTSSAVLPGVTVEAASPSLIEKVRSTISDAEGRYNFVDLVPGAYSVTFHADRLQNLEAGRDHVDVRIHRHHQRRPAGRFARGEHHGQRRRAGCRHAERPPTDDGDARSARRPADQHQAHRYAGDADARVHWRRRRRRPLFRRAGRLSRQARHEAVLRRHGYREQRRQQQLPGQCGGRRGDGAQHERHVGRDQLRRSGDEHRARKKAATSSSSSAPFLYTNDKFESEQA